MSAQAKPKALILVIDDEMIVHQSISRILEGEGYRVDGVLRVDEALERLKKTPYDLVLTDLMIPEKNGIEAVKAIARDYPGGEGTGGALHRSRKSHPVQSGTEGNSPVHQ
jgi:CheY-like chemotaxis protein